MKTKIPFSALFLFFCLLWGVSCSKKDREDALHLSNITLNIRGESIKGKCEYNDFFFPFVTPPIRPIAHYKTTGDSITYYFDQICYSTSGNGHSCNINIRLKEKQPLNIGERYSIPALQGNRITDIVDLWNPDSNYCYVQYCYDIDTIIPEGQTGILEFHNKYHKGFAQGYIEFTEIDRDKAWTKGRIQLYLSSPATEELQITSNFRLYTDF